MELPGHELESDNLSGSQRGGRGLMPWSPAIFRVPGGSVVMVRLNTLEAVGGGSYTYVTFLTPEKD